MSLFDILDHDTDKDLASVRIFQLDNNKVIVEKDHQYGFWSIKFEKGRMPDKLTGMYTSFSEAEKAVKSWLDMKNKEVREVTK